MIVQQRDQVLMYRCGVCGRVYRPQSPHWPGMHCLVMHLPGSCCHFQENLVDETG